MSITRRRWLGLPLPSTISSGRPAPGKHDARCRGIGPTYTRTSRPVGWGSLSGRRAAAGLRGHAAGTHGHPHVPLGPLGRQDTEHRSTQLGAFEQEKHHQRRDRAQRGPAEQPAPPRTGHRAACRRSRLRRCGIRRLSPRSAGHGGGRGPRPDRDMAGQVCGNELPSPGGRPRWQHKAAACEAAARLTGARLCISRIRSRHPARHCLWQLECRRPAFRGAADRSGAKDR